MTSKTSSELKLVRSQPTKQAILLDSAQLTKSEINSLRQKKKSIVDLLQKEFQGSLGDLIRDLKKACLKRHSPRLMRRIDCVCGESGV